MLFDMSPAWGNSSFLKILAWIFAEGNIRSYPGRLTQKVEKVVFVGKIEKIEKFDL